MYITIIESTFRDYPYEGTYISPDLDSAREYAIEMMGDIMDNTTNERQKRFAGFIINKLKTEKEISCGYGLGAEHIAVESMEKSIYEEKVLNTKEALEDRISSFKAKLKDLVAEYEKLKDGGGT